MRVYVIMGVGSTRKSSTIRALTGIAVCNVFDVAMSDGEEIPMLVCPQALQEAKKSPENFFKEVTKRLKKKNFDSMLIALRGKGIKKFPDGIYYLKEFRGKGWEIVSPLILLGKEKLENLKLEENGFQIHQIKNSREMASNKIAARIRKIWGWM